MADTTNEAFPSIPMYYKTYIDPKVDLDSQPNQPCPFHGEIHGKSFTYSKQLGMWRCWGQCHTGGDVVDLHRKNYKLKSREEAYNSLCRILGITTTRKLDFTKKEVKADEYLVHRNRCLALAENLAQTPDDWVELDFILSKVPFDVKELEVFCSVRGHAITEQNFT